MHRWVFAGIPVFVVAGAVGLCHYATAATSRAPGGATSTQYVLAYKVTDARLCRIEVSVNPSFTPLVYAVDPKLFPGSDTDGPATPGSRLFVVGRRDVSRASDHRYYSRALQANTTHYYRITGCAVSAASGTRVSCSASGCTGTFTTMNVPWGNTYPEVLPNDGNGHWLFPTGFPTDRSHTYIDPLTGVKVSLVTRYSGLSGAQSDWLGSTSNHPGMGPNGTGRLCSYVLVNNGAGPGYHCMFFTAGGNAPLYWIANDGSGHVNFIGFGHVAAGTDTNGVSYSTFVVSLASNIWSATDGNTFYYSDANNQIVKVSYASNDSFAGQNASISDHASMLVLNSATQGKALTTLLHNFDASFDPATFPHCAASDVESHYILGNCGAGQNAAAWLWAFDLNSNSLVAAVASYTNLQSRWCGVHGQAALGNYPVLEYSSAVLKGYTVTLDNNVDTTDTTFTISGQPSGTPFLKNVEAGDYFQFASGEIVKVVSSNAASTSWTVARAQDRDCHQQAHAAGETLTALCTYMQGPNQWNVMSPEFTACSGVWTGATDRWWDFVHDPHGTDPSNTYFKYDAYSGGHEVSRAPDLPAVKAGYVTISGYGGSGLMDIWNQGDLLERINTDPDIALIDHPHFGSWWNYSIPWHQSHTNYDQPQAPPSERAWTFDIRPFLGGSATVTKVSGATYIYQYTVGEGYPFSAAMPYFAIQKTTGPLFQPLIDISAPGSLLQDTTADNRKFCIAKHAGECWPASAAGSIYLNSSITPTGCGNTCIENASPLADGILQLGTVAPPAANQLGSFKGWYGHAVPVYGAARSRILIRGLLGPYLGVSIYANSHPLSDGSLAFFEVPWLWKGVQDDMTENTVVAATIPPQPTEDGVDRTNHENIVIAIGKPSGATRARVKYGFEENGERTSFFCTQRKETCYFSSHLPLNSTPTLRIGVPQRVLFYQIEYLNSKNGIVATDPVVAVAVP
jgi:hypothetical protein